MKNYDARIGIIIVGKTPDTLSALALGSCVGTVIYDPKINIASLAHVALPSDLYGKKASRKKNLNHPGRYADSAVIESIKLLKQKKANIKNLNAKIAGGSRMFGTKGLLGPGLNIGDRNIEAVKDNLSKNNIKLVGEHVGGDHSRTIKFNTFNNRLTIKKSSTGQIFTI